MWKAAFANLFASLPGGLEPVWEILAAVTPIVAGVLLLVARRSPAGSGLLLTQVLAIAATVLAGAAVSAAVDVPAGAQSLDGGQPDFPVLLLAAGSPRSWCRGPISPVPAGRFVDSVVWLSAIATAALAEGLPGAVAASLALGWGAAALAQLCPRNAGRHPVDRGPERGREGPRCRPDRAPPGTGAGLGQHAVHGRPDGDVWIDVVSRDSTDARLLAKLWRFIWYKDSGPTLSLTRAAPGRAPGLRRVARRPAPAPASPTCSPPAWPAGARTPSSPCGTPRCPAQRPGAGPGHRRRPRRRLGEPTAAPRRGPRPRQPLGGQRRARQRRHDGPRRPRGCAQLGLRRPPPAGPRATAGHQRRDRGRGPGPRRGPAGAAPTTSSSTCSAFLEPTALTSTAKRHVTKAKALLGRLRDKGAELTGVEPPELTELHRFPASTVVMAAGLRDRRLPPRRPARRRRRHGQHLRGGDLGLGALTFVVAQLPSSPRPWPCSARCRPSSRSARCSASSSPTRSPGWSAARRATPP